MLGRLDKFNIHSLPLAGHFQYTKGLSKALFSLQAYFLLVLGGDQFGLPTRVEHHSSEICFALHGAGLPTHRIPPDKYTSITV